MEGFCDCGNETSGFYKMSIISRLAKDLLDCHEGWPSYINLSL